MEYLAAFGGITIIALSFPAFVKVITIIASEVHDAFEGFDNIRKSK